MMIDVSIGIVGGGVVGAATARAFVEHVKAVRIYDSVPERRTETNVWDTLECDLAFVCLPTPQKKNSLECDTSILEKFFDEVREYRGNLVLRSTVPVGFTRRMRDQYKIRNLCHSPEFLTARCAEVNAQCPARNVVGEAKMRDLMGQGFVVTPMPWTDCGVSLTNLYRKRWPHVPCHVMSSDESEAGKLGLNSFFATKVAFFNELHAFCTANGLKWDNVLDVILSDGRVNPSHTQVPGPDGKYGFGGACLPKDLASLAHQMMQTYQQTEQVECYPHLTLAADERNEEDRKRN